MGKSSIPSWIGMFVGLFRIKPMVPFSSCSVMRITDLLKQGSGKKGSEMSRHPFLGGSVDRFFIVWLSLIQIDNV
jgi:hypothetical protein